MAPKRLVLDGLWNCLCPSFDIHTLNRSRLTLANKRFGRQFLASTALPCSISASQRRCRNTLSTSPTHESSSPKNNHIDGNGSTKHFQAHKVADQKGGNSDIPNAHHQLHDNKCPEDEDLSWRTPGIPKAFEVQSTPTLEAKLRSYASRPPNVQNAMEILRVLIRDRHLRPEAWHYKALIQSNSDPRRGTPLIVRRLLAEMERNGIPTDSGTLHAALQAVAVHPDYLLRQDILRILRDRWLPLSPDGWHYVVAGLIREHQLELALDHIALMERKDIIVESWLHSLLIYYLVEFGEFDQIIQLMRSRSSQGHDISVDLWNHVLDAAGNALHHGATCFIWERIVELGYLHPSHQLCAKVLAVASNEGDTELAASVARFLDQNDIPLQREDYEEVCKAHVVTGNLYAAFETLCEMHLAGVALQPSSTEPILAYTLQRKTPPREVWAILKRLKAAGLEIPLGCAKVVIEICEHGALNDPFAVDDGVAFYKELYTLCREKPDPSLYNALISMCRRSKNTESGMFIVKEMAAFDVIPDVTTFEHLILMCLESGNFESAYMYFHDLLERGLHPSEDVRTEIRELCVGSHDKFAAKLRYHPAISEGLLRSAADEVRAEEGTRLFHKIPTTPKGEMADLQQRVLLRDLERENTRVEQERKAWEARRRYNKERRKRKRRMLAIAKAQEEEGWMSYEPSGLLPEDDPVTSSKTSGG